MCEKYKKKKKIAWLERSKSKNDYKILPRRTDSQLERESFKNI